MACCPHRQHVHHEIGRPPNTIVADIETIGCDEHQVGLHHERALRIQDNVDRGLHHAPELTAADVLVEADERAAKNDLMAPTRRGRLADDAEIKFQWPVRLFTGQVLAQRQPSSLAVLHDDDGPIVSTGSQAASAIVAGRDSRGLV